jgi:hypothetical protein
MNEVRVEIGDKSADLNPDNCGIAIFRHMPEKNYFDYWEMNSDDEAEHWWVFHKPDMYIWLGRLCMNADEIRRLRELEKEQGRFTDLSGGWRPMVNVCDETAPYEDELYEQSIQNLAKDLDMPPDWITGGQ